MVEPLAIATAVVGFLSATVTLRNAIAQLMIDIDNVKTDHERLISTGIRLTCILIHISRWQQLWGVRGGTPDAILLDYWGQDGHNRIWELLTLTYQRATRMYNEHIEEYGHVLQISPHALGASRASIAKSTGLNETEEIKNLDLLKARHKNVKSLLSRTKTAVFSAPIVDKQLDSLEQRVGYLQTTSREYFIQRLEKYETSDWEDHISYIQLQHHLLHVANKYANASTALHDYIISNTEVNPFELHLDHRVHASERQEYLAKVAEQGFFEYHLFLNKSLLHRVGRDGLLCRIFQDHDSENLQQLMNIHFERFLRHEEQMVSNAHTAPTETIRSEPFTSPGPLVLEPVYYTSGQHELTKVMPLRTFMANTKTDYDDALQGDFSMKERIRLAYELAEWTLIFLKTRWFSNICSCCIIRMEEADLRTTYRARVHPVTHVGMEVGPDHNNKQWCEEEETNKHIRRLGILLMEVAFGEPVPDVAWHPSRGIEVDGELNLDDPDQTPILNRVAVNKKVRRHMGHDFMEIVDYCLQQDVGPTDVTEDHMLEFHEKVVQRLFIKYYQLHVKAPQRRQKRRHSKQQRSLFEFSSLRA